MKVIQPNCRVQFTSADLDFIVAVLGRDRADCGALERLLADEETRDAILDDETLYRAILEQTGCLRVSEHLYFYVLVRQVLRRAGIEDRAVADYVAEVLCEFSRYDRSRCLLPGQDVALEYFFEMVAALQTADERNQFVIRAFIANQALFLAGVFLDRIRFRAESRGFPDVAYYEQLGQANYRLAGDHRLAERFSLTPIFNTLADRFQETRLALNDVSQRLFSMGETDYSLEALLRRN